MNEMINSLASRLVQRGWFLGTAESCTGGLLSAALTDVAGSSAWFERGIVCYSYAAKQQLLDVPQLMLEQRGAVSEPVAEAMVAGMLTRYPVDLAVSITGIAGPDGGTPQKPVGTVCMASGLTDRSAEPEAMTIRSATYHFSGSRSDVRQQAIEQALRLLLAACD